ncbi:MAG: hypothetical protein HC781_22715 [Leptolyngbyaceae cyanobacterium CSU_1_4]|nr:hypothetical protein [Leptolyngbyaceae cyanobacterium CSU_1_4]
MFHVLGVFFGGGCIVSSTNQVFKQGHPIASSPGKLKGHWQGISSNAPNLVL